MTNTDKKSIWPIEPTSEETATQPVLDSLLGDVAESYLDVGTTQCLTVVKCVEFGAYLNGFAWGEILMPTRYLPEKTEVGDEIECFVYFDSEDRLIATTEKPLVEVGQCAALEVLSVTKIGAFLDWGLSKDLLLPYGEQASPLEVGETVVVYVYQDTASERIVASTKLHRHLPETSAYLSAGKPVSLLISADTELGYKAVIDGHTLGLLHHSETSLKLAVGQSVAGFIKSIRDDGKINLKLHGKQSKTSDALSEKILETLQRDGVSSLTDKSAPEAIFAQYQVSKAAYKRAIGQLYKARQILIEKNQIRLAGENASDNPSGAPSEK